MTAEHARSKTANEKISYEFDFARALWVLWQPGRAYSAGTYVRPTRPNGFAYLAAGSGQAAQDEPNWPVVVDNTVQDGSITWTCKAAGSNALDSIASFEVTEDAGITADDGTQVGSRIKVVVEGGTIGNRYRVRCKVTTTLGDVYEEILRITVT